MSKILCGRRVLFVSIAVLMIGALSSPVFAAVDNLPSDKYDDYDNEKYTQEYNESSARYESVRQALAQAESALQKAITNQRNLEVSQEQLRLAIVQAETDRANLITWLQHNQLRIQKLTTDQAQLQAAINAVGANLEHARHEHAHAEQEEQKARNAYQLAKAELDKRANARKTAKEESDKKSAAATTNQEALDKGRTELLKVQGQYITANSEKITLENRGIKLQSDLVQDKAAAAQAEADLRGVENKIQKISDELATLKMDLDVAQKAGDQAKVAEINLKITAKQAERDKVTGELAIAAPKVIAAKNKVTQTEKDIDVNKKDVEGKKKEIDVLDAKVKSVDADVKKAETVKPALDEAARAARVSLENADKHLAEQQKTTDSAKTKWDHHQEVSKGTGERVRNLDRENDLLRKRYALVSSQLQQELLEKVQNEQRLAQVSAQLGSYVNSKAQVDQQVAQAQLETRNRETTKKLQEGNLLMANEDLNRRNLRLMEVRSNLDRAAKRMNEVAGGEGGSDGGREGSEFGNEDGKRDGKALGFQQGKDRGTADGKDREYKAGYAVGKAEGEAKGREEAIAEAEADGKEKGQARGKSEGLKAAFETGKAQGLIEGSTNGSDKVAYKRGWDSDQGYKQGHQRAKNEAEPGMGLGEEGRGYNEKENEFLTAPLKKVELGSDVISNGFGGLQGAAGSKYGDGRYYNPRPKQYPHPEITRYYMYYYDASYRSTLDSTYESVYSKVKEENRRATYNQAYEEYSSIHYTEDEDQGESDAFAKYRPETYKQVYPVEYKIREQKHRDAIFEVVKKDPAETKRGFDVGNAIASEEKGKVDGRDKGYTENIENEKILAFQRGQARANKKYTENAVLDKTLTSQIIDGNGDSNFMSGETFYTEVVITNYGLRPKTGLKIDLKVQSGQASPVNSPELLPEIPPQSIAKIKGYGRVKISDTAPEGSNLGLSIRVLDGGSVIHQRALQQQILYPVDMQVVGFDGILIPGKNTELKLQLKNRSSKPQNLMVSLDLDSSKIDASSTEQTVSTLTPGSTTSVKFTLTGKPEASFESAPIVASVRQGGVLFAENEKIDATVIGRHKVDPASIGMILSSDMSKGGGKIFYSADKFDTWDTRVDGAVANPADLDPYLSKNEGGQFVAKAVHILVGDGFGADSSTMSSLRAYLAKGGTVMVWGDRLEAKGFLDQAGDLLGIRSIRPIALNTVVRGQDYLSGISISLAGDVASLESEDPRVVSVLTSSKDILGAMSHVGGLEKVIGRVTTLGVSPEIINVTSIRAVLASLKQVQVPFQRKLEMAEKDSNKLSLVLSELIEEVKDEDARTDVNWFKEKKGENTKMHKAVHFFIGLKKGHAARDAFVKRYSEIYAAIHSMQDGKNLEAASYVSDWVRVGSNFFTKRSWKDLYCENNAADICK